MAHILFSNVPLLKTCIGGLCPSLSFLQLGGFLQARGHQVSIHDVAVELDTQMESLERILEHMIARIQEERPQILGLSTKVPADGRFTRDLLQALRPQMPDLLVLVGGIWATPVHEELLRAVPEIDAVARGEGEPGLLALCERLNAGLNPLSPEVPGISYRGAEGEIIATPMQSAPSPEEHPSLALELMPSPDSYTIFPFLTSKGCPYDCNFCSEKVIFPIHVDTSLEKLKRDLQLLEDFGRDYYLWLSDPLFGANARRVEALCDLLSETRFHFLLESRVDVLRAEQLPRLWEAGCELIYYGLESASYSSLRRLNKLRSPKAFEHYLERARAQIQGCMRSDITPIFGILNPIPGDSEQDLEQTLSFLEEISTIGLRAAHESGVDPGFHFYSFQYRFIRGSSDANNLEGMAALGATWRQDPQDIFTDLLLHDASPSISAGRAAEFHRQVSRLVHSTPTGLERIRRSFPSQPKGGLG